MKMGGGWSFVGNLMKGLSGKAELVDDWRKAEICLIPSASVITKELFNEVKQSGKKIVLRVDNIPRNSRNRGTGTNRLKRMAEGSDLIIYQSRWAEFYVGYFLGKKGKLIYNGIDTDIFNPYGHSQHFGGRPTYIYSRYNRDETKRWEWAWYEYQIIQRANPEAQLVIIGQFSNDHLLYDFDFYNNEKYIYLGIIPTKAEIAAVYRGCQFMLATYSNDAYSNTYIEALCCGVKLYEPDLSGGTAEIIMNYKKGLEYNSCERMAADYIKAFETL